MDLGTTDHRASPLAFSQRPRGEGTFAEGERGSCVLHLRVLSPAEWETVALSFDDVGPESLPWLAETWWAKRPRDYVVLTEGQDVRAGALVTSVRAPMPISGLSLVKGGPLWRQDGEADLANFRLMVEKLREEYAYRRRRMLTILPPPDPEFGQQMAEELVELGFRRGFRNPYPETYFVDLSVPTEEIRAGFHQKWRYNLKRALGCGLELVQDTSPDGLDRFMRLYATMSRRKRFADSSAICALSAMFEAGSSDAVPEVFLVCRDGVEIAGAVISTAGTTATYLHGASADAALAVRAGYFMHWEVIVWLKQNTACRWYGLGTTEGSPGLRQFKSGMVGRTGVVVDEPPSFSFATRNRALLIGGALERLRALRATYFRFRSNLLRR